MLSRLRRLLLQACAFRVDQATKQQAAKRAAKSKTCDGAESRCPLIVDSQYVDRTTASQRSIEARGLTVRASNVGSSCCDTALAAAAYRRGELQCGPLKLFVTICCSVHCSLSRESTMNLLPRTSIETEGSRCSVHGSPR